MPTADKCRWIDALHASGIGEIEVASFVPARPLPQMADAAELVRHALTLPGLTVMALVPKLRGAQAALAAGVHKITLPVSASAAHSLANVRKAREEMVDEVRRSAELRRDIAPHVKMEAGISTAFGDRTGAAHMHHTRGLGLANCLAAYDVGVRTFDSSLAGLGGCPYAPGASGNGVTEDLVFMFEAMGVTIGIDLHRLIAARAPLALALPHEPLYGMTPEAGLPRGFVQQVSHV
jgi:hydroxymethylglutaryl-CoA lyase